MTASYVTLILDEMDATGVPVTRGSAGIAPSQRLPDPADSMLVGQAPVGATFSSAGPPSLRLVANDTIGPQQAGGTPGWTYTITYFNVPGNPQQWSFYLLSTNGPTQRLSALAQVPAAQPGQQYMPLPTGSPGAGMVPVATGAGEASAWGTVGGVQLAGDLGGTAASPKVTGIQGHSVATPGGTGIKYLRDDGTWDVPTGVIPLFSVTAAQAGGVYQGMSMTLRVLTGAAASQPGATAIRTGARPQQVTLTPAATGSLAYGAWFAYANGTAGVTSATYAFQDFETSISAAQFRTATPTTASTPVTLGQSGSNDGIGIAAAEILQASGQALAEDASSPSPVPWQNVTSMTTPQFQPPPGSLLVLTVTAVGSFSAPGGGTTTISVTDTSGLGLTWTQAAAENAPGYGYAGVLVAQVPAGYALNIPTVDDRTPAYEAGFTSGGGARSSNGIFGLAALYAAMATRDSAACSIPVIGDSITEGMGATTLTGRYVSQANRAIRQRYPTVANGSSGGLGYIPFSSTGETTYTWPISLNSGNGIIGYETIGPTRRGVGLFANTSTFTFTAPAGTTSVKIMYYNSGDGAQFSYQVNSGTVTTVTASGTVADGALTGSIPLTGGQVLSVTWVHGNIWLDGIIHYAGDETSGVTFHGCGHFGWDTGTGSSGWNQAQAQGIDWRASIAALLPAAIAVNLGTNDGSFSPSQSQVNLVTLISYLRGYSGLSSLPVLLIIPVQGAGSGYKAQWRAIPSLVANCWICDLDYRIPNATGAPSWYSDGVHPNNTGHAIYGETVAAAVRIA